MPKAATKTCKRCQKKVSVNNYYLRGTYKDGRKRYSSYCKPCHRIKCKESNAIRRGQRNIANKPIRDRKTTEYLYSDNPMIESMVTDMAQLMARRLEQTYERRIENREDRLYDFDIVGAANSAAGDVRARFSENQYNNVRKKSVKKKAKAKSGMKRLLRGRPGGKD